MIDLVKGINFQIQGELGRFNTIPIDALVQIASNFQKLVFTIAEHEITGNESIDLSNFRLELSGFRGGSAIPEFKFTPRTQTVVGGNVVKQRQRINRRLDGLLKIANRGEYHRLKDIYKRPALRNVVVNNLYEFVHSFKNAPVSVVEVTKKNEIKPVYRIRKFNNDVKTSLLVPIKQDEGEQIHESFGVAKIKILHKGGQLKKKIEELYKKNVTTLAYSPEVIVYEDKIYNLHFPLRSLFEKEDNFYVIKNELLDIIGTGLTEDDAEKNFAEEFDYIYTRLNELSDEGLTTRVQNIKRILNSFVKSVEV